MGESTIYKAYKYRMYPTKEQKVLLHKHMGCSRWIYNHCLEKKIKAYEKDQTSLSKFDLIKLLPNLKKDESTSWLKEVNSQSLQASIDNMNKAFKKFFQEKAGFPKFKSKHYSKSSFHIPQNVKLNAEDSRLSIPKIKDIKVKLDRNPEGTIKSATITKTPSNKYFVSVLVDTHKNIPDKPQLNPNQAVGIDLGIKDFVVTSKGKKVKGPRSLKKSLKRLKHLQRKASKKVKGSNNRRKANLRVAKKHEKIRNIRHDFLHKLSSRLISENQAIILEDLNVQGMIKNHCLAQHIQDCSWGTFVSYLKYKSEWNGVHVVQIGRFEPSSKICSECGYIHSSLTLQDRHWDCPQCLSEHDRDVNAAKNILQIGLKDFYNNLGQELPEVKPLESSSLEVSVKEETARSLA